MGMNIPLLNSCCWLSLRTGVIIIGSLELFFYILYFVDILIFRLWLPKEMNERYLFLITDIVFEYAETIQIFFSGVLIYGALKEKSSFVCAWLLTEISRMVDGIWNMILISIWYFHWDFFMEQIIQMVIATLVLWVVYSFYSTMPKSKYIL